MARTESQVIADYFYNAKNIKTTPAQYRLTLGQAKQLLDSGYSKDEIKDSIDYLIENPPEKGFFSLGFLSYCINNVLSQIKKNETRKLETIKEKEFKGFETVQISDNKNKFEKTNEDYLSKFR